MFSSAICRECSTSLTSANWMPSLQARKSRICKPCNNNYFYNWRLKNPLKAAKIQRRSQQKVRLAALIHYGGGSLACVACGFSDERTLTIDHIEGGGRAERRILGTHHIGALLKKRGYPEGYQTLCMNCQMIKER